MGVRCGNNGGMSIFKTLRSVMRFKPIELDGNKRRLTKVANVEDFRVIAKKRLPRAVFDYIDGAAEDERTMGRNASKFSEIEFVPKVLVAAEHINTETTLLGKKIPSPLVLAPTGFTRICHSEGELSVARAAARRGIPYGLSTMSTRSIEEVGSVSNGPKWFQVYVWRDRDLVAQMLNRAKVQGFETIMITVDTAVLGMRERDVRNGMTMPPRLGLGTIIDGIKHPSWTRDFITHDPITFANIAGYSGIASDDAVTLGEFNQAQFDLNVKWSDIEWFRENWDGPIVLKGIQCVDDAKQAVNDHGIEGLMLSNHGGRQLEGAPAVIETVEPIANAVGHQSDIICDGGIRRGSDIVKAIAMGAKACSIGRPYLYALGAGREPGVDHMLDLFEGGLKRTMALAGCQDISDITRDRVRWQSEPIR